MTTQVKNECAKTRKVNEPYEIWKGSLMGMDCEWRVLKKWQADDNKPYGRWFCAVKTVACGGGYDMGDVYVSEIKAQGSKVEFDPAKIERW